MNKISTIAAAIFLSIFTPVVTKAAHSSCTVTPQSTSESLSPIGTPAFQMRGNTTVTVDCNDIGKSVQFTIGSGTILPSGSLSYDIAVRSGTSGVFNVSGSRTSATIIGATPTGGSLLFLTVVVKENSFKLLKSGNYTVAIDVSITP